MYHIIKQRQISTVMECNYTRLYTLNVLMLRYEQLAEY